MRYEIGVVDVEGSRPQGTSGSARIGLCQVYRWGAQRDAKDGREVMAQGHLNDPEHWRRHAEEMRRLAQEVSDPETKQIILNLANEYDKLAKRAQELPPAPSGEGARWRSIALVIAATITLCAIIAVVVALVINSHSQRRGEKRSAPHSEVRQSQATT
jgi:hypothetical protein